MWRGTTMTRKWRFFLVSTRSVKSLPFWIPWRIPHSQYLQWLQVMVVFISNLNILSISPMFRICDRYLDWEIKRSYYLLHSMDRTWLISLEIAKWSKCTHRWSLVRCSDLKMLMANQNNNLLTTMTIDDPTTNYSRSVEDICIPMITRFDWLLLVLKDLTGNIIHLNGEFELQLTIEYRVVCECKDTPTLISTNQFSMIEVLGNTTKKEVNLDNPLSFDQCSISSMSLYSDFVLHNVQSDQVIVINWCGYMVKLWKTFNIKTWGEYYELCNVLDVTLMADAFEHFRNTTLKAFGVDPMHFIKSQHHRWRIRSSWKWWWRAIMVREASRPSQQSGYSTSLVSARMKGWRRINSWKCSWIVWASSMRAREFDWWRKMTLTTLCDC